MFCTNCGAKVADGARFCTNCGATLSDPSPAEVQPGPTMPEWSGAPQQQVMPPQMPQKRHSKAKIIIPIVAVVVVAAVSVAAFLTNGFGLMGVPVRATVNDYSWDELSRISAQISACGSEDEAVEIAKSYNLTNPDGTLDGTQVKQVELTDGTTTEVQIIGFYHDDKSDGSGKAGISFMFVDGIASRSMNSSDTTAGGWKQSEARAWLNSDFLAQLPEDMRTRIISVDKLTNNDGATADSSSVTATTDSLWLLSHTELTGSTDGSNPLYAAALDAEGTQYQLFANCNVSWTSGGSILTKNMAGSHSGAGVYWWQRSPAPDSNAFLYTNDSYGSLNGAVASEELALIPGFCI